MTQTTARPVQRNANRILPVSLLVATLGLTQPSLAQPGSDIDQDGVGNSATITQIDAPSAYAHITQDGNINGVVILHEGPVAGSLSATAVQYGTTNNVSLQQANAEVAVADVVQGGLAHFVEGLQISDGEVTLYVEQSGERQSTFIYQEGNAAAEVIQVGDNHFANIDQMAGLTLGLAASVYQEGSYNSINLLQEGDAEGGATTHQIGNNNMMDVHQYSDGIAARVFATLTTEGDNNLVTVFQDGFQNRMTLTQTGDGNVVDTHQAGEAVRLTLLSYDSNNNIDTISQRASSSDVYIERRETHNSSTTVTASDFFVDARLMQLSSMNSAITVTQNLMGGEANVTQDRVEATTGDVYQTGGVNASSTITQGMTSSTSALTEQYEGLDLIATIYQSNGSDLMAAIDQTGTNVEAHITQINTSGVDAYIYQAASNSYAEITQSGGASSGNASEIHQTGDGYSASISQAGLDNSAIITQM